ncbi:MAG TPA: hypothetical protein VKU37_13475 [Verrucomicrobiae bacterium]|nr:hypothetical protein [Verrucomicrobiae bacterium]
MNRTNKITLGVCGLAAAALMSGCIVRPYGGVAVEAPAPVVAVGVYPDDYVWDGYEYVGVVGGQYYYLGPGQVWIVCEPWRLQRFHGWERYHADWHDHAIHNDRYRDGGHDNDHNRDRDQGHDQNHGHGHDHDDGH